MHAAPSIMIFTVLSGAGFGAAFWIGLGFGADSRLAAFLLCGASVLFAGVGLVSSVFHLRRPDRAWRAFSQWRSSWLSREGVLAVLAMGLLAILGLIWITGGGRPVFLGLLLSVAALATIFATSMIYAQLRAVPDWNTPLVPLRFLAFGLVSGLLLVTAVDPGPAGTPVILAILLGLVVAWGLKLMKVETRALPSAGHATGLAGMGDVRAFEPASTARNYVSEEMVMSYGRDRKRAIRRLGLLMGLAVPVVLMGLALVTGGIVQQFVLVLALISLVYGLFCERWLFFAEARHVVSAYF